MFNLLGRLIDHLIPGKDDREIRFNATVNVVEHSKQARATSVENVQKSYDIAGRVYAESKRH